MPKRNTHKKSRTGCSSCKKRHVKCDERGPPCANCRVRNLACDFESPRNPTRWSKEPQIEEKPGTPSAIGSKRLELELLHHWTSETCRSLIFQDGDEYIWQTTIPQTAFQHEYLLNSLYAMSSLHRSLTASSSLSEHYRLAALEYQNMAITAFRTEGRHITPETSPPLFAFSAINLVLAIAFPSCQIHESQANMVDSLSTVLELLRGTVSIFTSSREWLPSGPFGGFARRSSCLHSEDLDPETRLAFDRLRVLRDEDYAVRAGSADGVYLFECTTAAIDHLEVSFGLQGDNGQVVPFSWLSSLQLGFVAEISRYGPLALLIIMHWAILLETLSTERWWARLSGKRLVAETATILLSCRPDWLPAVSWAHSQVGLPPPLISGSREQY